MSQSTIRARWRSSEVRGRRHIRQAEPLVEYSIRLTRSARARRRWTTFIRVLEIGGYVVGTAALIGLYVVLSRQSANMMPAILRASATIAMNFPRRSSI